MCGIFGAYTNNEPLLNFIFPGLFSLQHRGQESAGIVTTDGTIFYNKKNMGLVSDIFHENDHQYFKGSLGIGHTRYSTTGSSDLNNCQPMIIKTQFGTLAICQNGTLVNYEKLKSKLIKSGIGHFSESDIEVIGQYLSNGNQSNKLEEQIIKLIEELDGAFSLLIMTNNAIYCCKDKYGFRPLFLGSIEGIQNNYFISSETCAFNTINGKTIREVNPGELVKMDLEGFRTVYKYPTPQEHFCLFEIIYFSRPDSVINNTQVHHIRQNIGMKLAQECKPIWENGNIDIVFGIPDSATPHAIGFAKESGIPYSEGLTKNRYIGRTFIYPDQNTREKKVRLKFNALRDNIKNKNIIVVDDSIVRGNTLKYIIKILKENDVNDIHVCIASPPIKYPCHMGIDMSTSNELIAYSKTTEEICTHLGANSLSWISLKGVQDVVSKNNKLCNACWTGNYPVDLDW